MAKIVIIGAGLTGLSTAYHLEKKGFSDFSIFEKESEIGGLCRSVQQDGFTFDYTGHLLHTSDIYFRKIIEELVGIENLNTITRRSFIYSHNTFSAYPFQINLQGLPTKVIAECIEGFVKRKKIKKQKTFLQWVQSNFGDGFGKHFFYPYQQKIFAYNLQKITASWTGRFVPQTSLEQIVDGIIGNTQSVGYNANFLYPKQGGIHSWVQKFAMQVKKPIQTNCTVTKIDTKNKLVYFANGHRQKYDHLVSTMPLDCLLGLLQERSNNFLKRAQNKLICNSVINFNLGINRENLSDKHWIYFPEDKFPFYRMGFYHNFSKSMAPRGCSSVYGEFAHINKPNSWIQKTTKKSIKKAQELLEIKNSEILTKKIMPISHAYVIYDAWRETNLPKIHNHLHQNNIYSIGRYGHWKYASMQEAVLDGRDMVNQLLILPAQRYWQPKKDIKKKRKNGVRISS